MKIRTKTSIQSILLMTFLGLSACHGDSTIDESAIGSMFTLDLTHYDPQHTPSSLRIANETLAFPLSRVASPPLSRTAPGALRVLYTRVGCRITDPGSWIVSGLGSEPLPAPGPVRVVGVTIEQTLDNLATTTLDALARNTCFSYRTADGAWQPLLAPTSSVVAAGSVRSGLGPLPVPADAIAVFLADSYVTRITYEVQASN